jgi:chromatin assembly factor 1 subunit B
MSAISHSAASSVSGSVLGKRDFGGISESEKDEPSEKAASREADGESAPAPKRKRIAPTLISSVKDNPTG